MSEKLVPETCVWCFKERIVKNVCTRCGTTYGDYGLGPKKKVRCSILEKMPHREWVRLQSIRFKWEI